jgi:hypothetical protein
MPVTEVSFPSFFVFKVSISIPQQVSMKEDAVPANLHGWKRRKGKYSTVQLSLVHWTDRCVMEGAPLGRGQVATLYTIRALRVIPGSRYVLGGHRVGRSRRSEPRLLRGETLPAKPPCAAGRK